MIKEIEKLNTNIVKIRAFRKVSLPISFKIDQSKIISKLKAYQYKNECIEALREGKAYSSAKELREDAVNW